jgi:hypothetical protein
MMSSRGCPQDQEGGLTTTVEESVPGIRMLTAFDRGPELLRKLTVQARELRAIWSVRHTPIRVACLRRGGG